MCFKRYSMCYNYKEISDSKSSHSFIHPWILISKLHARHFSGSESTALNQWIKSGLMDFSLTEKWNLTHHKLVRKMLQNKACVRSFAKKSSFSSVFQTLEDGLGNLGWICLTIFGSTCVSVVSQVLWDFLLFP